MSSDEQSNAPGVMSDSEVRRRLETPMKHTLDDIKLTLRCIEENCRMEIDGIENGKVGDILTRIKEIEADASDALKHALTYDTYRRILEG